MDRNLVVSFTVVLALSACSSPPLTDVELTDYRKPAPSQPYNPTVIGDPALDDLLAASEKNIGDRVFFELDSSALSADAQATLGRQAAWLKKYRYRVVIEGHADERGTREYNLALGVRRANAARNFLIARGVPPDSLAIISYGKERPAVIGHNENVWSQNRRAVSVLQNVPHL